MIHNPLFFSPAYRQDLFKYMYTWYMMSRHSSLINYQHALEYQATPVSLLYSQQTSGWGWGMMVGTQDLDFSISLDVCCGTHLVLQCNWPLFSHGVRFQPSFIPAPSILTLLRPLPPSLAFLASLDPPLDAHHASAWPPPLPTTTPLATAGHCYCSLN